MTLSLQQPLLPCITTDLPGIGGEIKVTPDDFQVTELPRYEPKDEGPHVYVSLTRSMRTTRVLASELAKLFSLRSEDVGYAGLKDRNARVCQVFSLYLPTLDLEELKARIRGEIEGDLHWARRHQNKLKRGHLLGNRFRLRVRGVVEGAGVRAHTIWERIQQCGLPNAYGPQRQGRSGDNAARGRAVLEGKRVREKWLRNLLLNAYQSKLFNQWLGERIENGHFQQMLVGDVAKKRDSGGLFVVTADELEDGNRRLQAQEIAFTGPIFGWEMRWPKEGPLAHERGILEAEGLAQEAFRKVRLKGTRRAGCVWPGDFEISEEPGAMIFEFSLPSGSYATTLMHQFQHDTESTELLSAIPEPT